MDTLLDYAPAPRAPLPILLGRRIALGAAMITLTVPAFLPLLWEWSHRQLYAIFASPIDFITPVSWSSTTGVQPLSLSNSLSILGMGALASVSLVGLIAGVLARSLSQKASAATLILSLINAAGTIAAGIGCFIDT